MSPWVFRILIMTCCVIYIGDRGYFYYGEYQKYQLAKARDLGRNYCNLLQQKKNMGATNDLIEDALNGCRAQGLL